MNTNLLRPSWKGSGHAYPRPRSQHGKCQICGDLCPTDPLRRAPSMRKIDMFDIADSADSGDCLWCSLIYRSMIEQGASLPEPGTVSTIKVIAEAGQPIYVEWTTTEQYLAVEIYQLVGQQPSLPELGVAQDIGSNIMSGAVFDMIRNWVEQCNDNHIDCKPANIASMAPRRLIDIGDPYQTVSQQSIRLVENIEDHVRYIALSHCWGDIQTFTTNTGTLADRLAGISWDELPKTYQDTVTVARRLGVRYLWIDSLCIIQDDSNDWSTESAKMGEIYEGSYLTLAAALAPADDIGFLDPAPERARYKETRIDLSDFGKGDEVRVRRIHDIRTLSAPHPLEKRAWTLQEALLPPRLLTFSVTAFFECREGDACECGSGLLPNIFCADRHVFSKPDRSAYASFIRGEMDEKGQYEYWRENIVQEYSTRQLKFSKDRFPALNAMTSTFSRKTNDMFLAGLWKNDLPYQLAWYARFPRIPLPEVAPTWSWASLQGAVTFSLRNNDACGGEFKFRHAAEFLSGEIDDTATGKMHHRTLEIIAYACWAQLKVVSTKNSDSGYIQRHYELRREGYEDDCIRSTLDSKAESIYLDTQEYAFKRAKDGTFVKTEASSWYCIRVCCTLIGELWRGTWAKRTFLLLKPNSSPAGDFHRIGLFEVGKTSTTPTRRSTIWFEDMDRWAIAME